MKKRRSKQEWISLVSQYMNSGLSMTKWCKENGVSVSSIGIGLFSMPKTMKGTNKYDK